jgi:hypothetical protein
MANLYTAAFGAENQAPAGGCHMSDQAQKIVGKSAKSKTWIVLTFSILFCALRGCFMCEEGLEKGLAEKNYRK